MRQRESRSRALKHCPAVWRRVGGQKIAGLTSGGRLRRNGSTKALVSSVDANEGPDIGAVSLAGEFLALGSSTFFLQFTRFAVALLAAKIVGPEEWGRWYLLSLVLTYGVAVHFGILNGMNREVPLFHGKRDLLRVERIRASALGSVLITSSLACVGIAGFALVVPRDEFRWLLLHLVPLFVATQLHVWLQTYLRSAGQFRLLAKEQLGLSGAFLLIVPAFIVGAGLPGYLWGQSLALGTTTLAAVWLCNVSRRPALDLREVLHLARVGLPILLVGLLFSVFTTVDRWVVAGFLGTTELGYYSLALMVSSGLNLIPLTVAQQMYPRMAEARGRGADPSRLLLLVRRQVRLGVGLSLPMVVLAGLAVGPLVNLALRDYRPGLVAVYPLLLCPVLLNVVYAFGNFLNTVDKQKRYLVVQVVMIPVVGLLASWAARSGWGLAGVAWAVVAGFAIYAAAMAASGLAVARR